VLTVRYGRFHPRQRRARSGFEKVMAPQKTARFHPMDRRLGYMVELQLSSRIPLVKT
jgi:hypothetical protein